MNSKTDITISKILGFLNFKVSAQGEVSLNEFFASEGRQLLLDDISFNPTHTIQHGAYDIFLTYKIASNYKEYASDPFYVYLKHNILSLAAESTYVASKPGTIDEIKKISEGFLFEILNNYNKDDVFKHPYLVCSALRGVIISYIEGVLKKDIQTSVIHAIAVSNAILNNNSIYGTLLQLDKKVDSYEKLNAIFLPSVEHIYAITNSRNKSSPSLKTIK
jgi:hypothetical protein